VKFSTFYHIYYKHRFYKAKSFLKFFLYFQILISFFHHFFFNNKKINLDKLALKNKDLFNKDLNYLFEYFNSDKGFFFIDQFHKTKQNKKIHGHQYSEFYQRYFNDLKDKKLEILEIGSFKGAATAALKFFFKNSKIYAGDLYPDISVFFSKDIFSFKIDNSSEEHLNNFIVKNNTEYDIIIEDAGHFFKDQIISLFILFKKLKSNGFFVIEELDFPDTREDSNVFKESPTLLEILNYIINKKDFNSKYINKFDKNYFLNNFEFIHIYKGRTNKIVFIKKK
jgi:hypothetical protein